jgi:exopolysaccharide biosynthesis protein
MYGEIVMSDTSEKKSRYNGIVIGNGSGLGPGSSSGSGSGLSSGMKSEWPA